MTRSHHPQRWAALLALLGATYLACSDYDGSNRVSCPPMLVPDVPCGGASSITAGASHGGAAHSAGAAGSVAGIAGAVSAGSGGTSAAGGSTAGMAGTGAAGTSSGGTNSAGAGGSSPAGASGTNTAGANTAGAGGSTTAGSGGANTAGGDTAGAGGATAGAGGASAGAPAAGNGGAAPAGGSGGSAGGGAIEQLLSQGKTASADSEQTGHLAALGNDGATDTRWCAANGAANHYWQVDLGQSYVLSKLTINWEQAANYQFKVEGSADGSTWSSVLDQTQSTDATANQTYPLNGAPSARYVRITTTTLPSTAIWASFFELKVYGH